MDRKKALTESIVHYVGRLTDHELERHIEVLGSDENGFDLKQLIIASGPRIALTRALIHLARAQLAEDPGISMKQYLWFKHEIFPRILSSSESDEEVPSSGLDLDTLERALLEDVESDEAWLLTALVWSTVFLTRTHIRILQATHQLP
jgi:hypothetical protein